MAEDILLETGIYQRTKGGYKILATCKDPHSDKILRQVKTLSKDIPIEEVRQTRLAMIEAMRTRDARAHAQERSTLEEFALRWISRKAKRLKPRPKKTYEDILAHKLLPHFGDLYLDSVRREDVEEWIAWAEQQTREDGEHYSDSTLSSWWRILKMLLCDAYAEGALARDVTYRLRPPKRHTPPKREQRTLSAEEVQALLDATKQLSPHRYAEILTLAYTGIRSGELYGLKWADVDQGAECLHIRRSASGGHITSPKTHVSRQVYAPAVVFEALAAQRRALLEAQHPGLEQGWVFPSDAGTPRTESSLSKPLAAACSLSKLSVHVTPQVLRRTYNSLAVARGVDHAVLQAQMGHSSEQMTMRYSAFSMSDKQAALGSLFAQATPQAR